MGPAQSHIALEGISLGIVRFEREAISQWGVRIAEFRQNADRRPPQTIRASMSDVFEFFEFFRG